MEDPRYVSYITVLLRYGARILLASAVVFVLTYGICALPFLQKYKASTTILFPLRKSAAGLRRALGSLDIPVGSVSASLGQVQETYPAPTLLKSRTVTKNVLEQYPAVLESIDKKGKRDWEAIRKRVVKKHLDLSDTDQGALHISFVWKDAQLAADVANAYVTELKRMLTILNAENAAGLSEFVEQKIEGGNPELGPGVKQQLEAIEREIADYKTREGVLALDPQAEQLIKTAATLQEELTSAEVELAESSMKLRQVKNQGQKLHQVSADLYSRKDRFDLELIQQGDFLSLGGEEPEWRAVPSLKAMEDAAVITLRRNLSVLENERAEKRLLFTDDHPSVVKLTKDIIQMKAQLAAELAKYHDAFEAEVHTDTLALEAKRTAAQGLLQEVNRQIEAFPEKERGLLKLQRDQEVLEKVFILMAQELEQTRLAEQAEDTTFTLLDPAIVPSRPASPKKLTTSLAAGAIVFLLGLFWGAGQERRRLDRLASNGLADGV